MKIVFEKIVPKAGSSFAILDKLAPAFDGRFHFHPEVEITLIESSTGRRVVGDSIEPFAPGDLVLIRDHLNLTGCSPLVGPHHAAFGPRFPDPSSV